MKIFPRPILALSRSKKVGKKFPFLRALISQKAQPLEKLPKTLISEKKLKGLPTNSRENIFFKFQSTENFFFDFFLL